MHNININERKVLASLRALVPQRRLELWEAKRIAELQASHLLGTIHGTDTAVPEELVSELPRVRVIREAGLPISGAAHWNGRHWIITLNADEPLTRQRFSLMHEFKHVLDHSTKQFLYHEAAWQTAGQQAELVADYFAACLLMPKKLVKRLWCQGNQDMSDLAQRLNVSAAAIRVRLDQLGLTERPDRCLRGRVSSNRPYPRLRAPAPTPGVTL